MQDYSQPAITRTLRGLACDIPGYEDRCSVDIKHTLEEGKEEYRVTLFVRINGEVLLTGGKASRSLEDAVDAALMEMALKLPEVRGKALLETIQHLIAA